ncbi:MAG: hypothetical protein IKZ87_00130 [Actinomycetaceae bacterium]|nr:hypothetical protein [Actinomycetaceae bacterium]
MSKGKVICNGGELVAVPTSTIKSLVTDAMQNLHQAWHRLQSGKERGIDTSRMEAVYRSAQQDWKKVLSLPGCDRRIVRSIVTKYYWRKRHWYDFWDVEYPSTPAPALRRAMCG